jgi:hypothetical protein
MRNERIAQKWETKEIVSDWFWATTMGQALTSSAIVGLLGYDRGR